MNQSFVIAAIVFLGIMVGFHLIANTLINLNTYSPDMLKKVNKRWLISTLIGLVILYVVYGRAGP